MVAKLTLLLQIPVLLSLVVTCGRKKHVRTRKRARPIQPEEPGDKDLLSFRSGSQPVSVQISACSAGVVDVVTCTDKSLQTKDSEAEKTSSDIRKCYVRSLPNTEQMEELAEEAERNKARVPKQNPRKSTDGIRIDCDVSDSDYSSKNGNQKLKDSFQEGLNEVKGPALLTPSITNNSEMEAQNTPNEKSKNKKEGLKARTRSDNKRKVGCTKSATNAQSKTKTAEPRTRTTQKTQ